MMPLEPELERLFERACLYGALHDSFAPTDAVRWANEGTLPHDIQIVARVLALLRPDCADAGQAWSMRPAARHHALSAENLDEETASVAASFDTPIADARFGRGDFASDALAQRVGRGEASDDLASIIGALDRAGPDAPGAAHLLALRGILNRLSAEQRTDAVIGDTFVGREAELARIAGALATPQSAPPLKAIFVSGIAGIGKSHVLERALQLARLDTQPVIVRLDFDRSGLDVRDAQGFFHEISRQVGDSLPAASAVLHDVRLDASGDAVAATRDYTPARTALPGHPPLVRLLEATAQVVNDAGKLLLIVLDTLEALRSEGETRIPLLFDRLDRLAMAGTRRIAIIAAGRNDSMEPASDRVLGAPLELKGLDGAAVGRLLEARDVPRDLWPRINRLARGNPALLDPAAQAIALDGFDDSEVPADAEDAAVGGHLYRAILSRVPQDLRGLATGGLVLAELDFATLQAVVAPVVAPDMPEGELRAIFDALRDRHWLLSEEGDNGTLRHSAGPRRAFLPLFELSDPEIAKAIDRRAVDWFDRRDNPFPALYHRLRLTRAGDPMPDIPADLAGRFDALMIDELPEPARAALRRAKGMRSDFGRTGQVARSESTSFAAPDAQDAEGECVRFDTRRDGIDIADRPPQGAHAPDSRALSDLDLTLSQGDLREAEFVVQNALRGWMPAAGPSGRLLMAHLWLTGRWSSARKLFDLHPEGALEAALDTAPLLHGRVLLDMTAEFRFDALVRRLRDPDFRARILAARAASTQIGIDGGALDFALLSAVSAAALPARLLQTALGLLAHNGNGDRETEARLHNLTNGLRRRHGLVSEPEPTEPADRSQDLAILNPYADVLSAVLMRLTGGALATFVTNAETLPRAAAAHFAPTLRDMAEAQPEHFPVPGELGEAFRGMGLAAEWIEGFTLFNPVADLPTLAHSAERWRRTAAGDWCYGRNRPGDWTAHDAPDRVTLGRAWRLMRAHEPVAAARAQLFFWSRPTHDGPAAARHLSNRFGARYARTLATLPAGLEPDKAMPPALAQFTDAGITAIIAAPLAVLAAHRQSPDRVFAHPDA